MIRPLLLALLLLPCVAHAERYVLAVGHDRGDPDQTPLRYAEAEARAFHDLVQELGDVTDGELLLGSGKARLEEALTRLEEKLKATEGRKEVLVFLSGHARDGVLSLNGEPWPADALRARLDALPADLVVAFVDACTAGQALRSKGAVARSGYALEVAPSATKGRVVIASTGRSSPAWESDRAGGSLFARQLLVGLRGAADSDGDGAVELGEAWSFLYERTLAESLAEGVAQRPELDADVVGAGEIVLTRTGGATLVLGAASAGAEVWVVDAAAGRAVAELGPERPSVVRLAVPAGPLQVYTRQDGRARLQEFTLRDGQSRELRSDDGRIASARPIRARGGALVPRRPSATVGYRTASGVVDKGRFRHGLEVLVDGQVLRWLRVGGAVNVGVGQLSLEGVQVEELELGAEGGAWLSPAGRVQPFVGARVGLGVLSQYPRWSPAGGWHTVEQPELEPSHLLTVPFVAEAGLLVRLGVVGLRVGAQGGMLVVEDAGGAIVAPRAAFSAGLVVAP